MARDGDAEAAEWGRFLDALHDSYGGDAFAVADLVGRLPSRVWLGGAP